MTEGNGRCELNDALQQIACQAIIIIEFLYWMVVMLLCNELRIGELCLTLII